MISQKAFHGYKLPRYQQITRPSFQPIMNELFGRMKNNTEKQHRRSIRLKGYDYSQPGAYFITICTQNRACLFGEIVDR